MKQLRNVESFYVNKKIKINSVTWKRREISASFMFS